MKEIECVINKDGTVEIDMIGFKGKGCAELAEELAKALGSKISLETKREFNESEVCNKEKIRAF